MRLAGTVGLAVGHLILLGVIFLGGGGGGAAAKT
jgi:hypothetical protein